MNAAVLNPGDQFTLHLPCGTNVVVYVNREEHGSGSKVNIIRPGWASKHNVESYLGELTSIGVNVHAAETPTRVQSQQVQYGNSKRHSRKNDGAKKVAKNARRDRTSKQNKKSRNQ